MSDHIVEDGAFINSIVGEGTRFRGELELNGLLRIDGDYDGVIRTPDKVLVGKNGRAECTIYAGEVVIGGVIKGDVYSQEKVVLLSTGMVIGNIHTPRLIVEEGVIIDGQCRVNTNFNPLDDSEISVNSQSMQERKEASRDENEYRPVVPQTFSDGSQNRDFTPAGETGWQESQENRASRSGKGPADAPGDSTGNTADRDQPGNEDNEDSQDRKVSAWNG